MNNMPRKAVTVTSLVPNPERVKVRTEGMQLVNPLKPLVVALKVTTDVQYKSADALLGRIGQARKTWAEKVDPIRQPLKRAMDELKASMDAVKALDVEVDGPLAGFERDVKRAMADFQLEDRRRKDNQKRLEEAEANRIRDEAQRKIDAATAARTPQMKAKLSEQAQTLIAQAQTKEVEMETSTAPVRGDASSSRFVEKPKITDPATFLLHLKSYEPRAGIYEIGAPPLSLVTQHTTRTGEKVEEGSAIDKIEAEMMKIYATQPGVVTSWPGVELVEDVIIAKR